jgi:hypothetical protein
MTGEPLDSDPVRSRGPAAVVQLVAFVGGGFLGPVWHLTHHRNDHTHEADGRTAAFGLGDDEETGRGHTHAHEAEEPSYGHGHGLEGKEPAEELAESHPHLHAHPHARLGHAGAHEERAHAPAELHEPAAPPAPSDGRHAATPLPAPLDHGHASIAHFGLALLGAPALLAVPAPQPGEWVVVARSTAALRLFHPSFPRPRPPPPSRPA